jgi:hypothetical protein
MHWIVMATSLNSYRTTLPFNVWGRSQKNGKVLSTSSVMERRKQPKWVVVVQAEIKKRFDDNQYRRDENGNIWEIRATGWD